MARDTVEQGCHALSARQTHIIVSLVDHHFLHHELIFWHAGHAIGKYIHASMENGWTADAGKFDEVN